MNQKELQLELEQTIIQLHEAKRQLNCLKDGLHYYADVNAEWDRAIHARVASSNCSKPDHKPLDNEVARVFENREPNLVLGPIGIEDEELDILD